MQTTRRNRIVKVCAEMLDRMCGIAVAEAVRAKIYRAHYNNEPSEMRYHLMRANCFRASHFWDLFSHMHKHSRKLIRKNTDESLSQAYKTCEGQI